MSFPTPQDLSDLQGDVVLGIPKRSQEFLFFTIEDVTAFKKDLVQLIPLITTTAQIQQTRQDIENHKKSQVPGLIKTLGINIGFTKQGLAKLGATDDLGDIPFNNGMLKDAQTLGDGALGSDGTFDNKWSNDFKNESAIDGIILVAAESKVTVLEGVAKVNHVLCSSIKVAFKVEGEVRPDKEKGHEHFGFLDGISAPAIPALTGHLPGQIDVDPGVIVCGQQGDSITTRPTWTKNGSFLAYRQLSQLVPEFDKFLTDNPIDLPGLTREQGSELAGARLVGRWKSGAPIDVTPLKDDPALAADKQRNNNFDFSDTLKQQTRCPFAAHIRKTNPRQDIVTAASEAALTTHMLNRQGIPFGPEVTLPEKLAHKSIADRGLAFVCYQSNLANGFEFVQQSWANNVGFMFGEPVNPGFDPIIGQKNSQPRTMSGLQTNNLNGETNLPQEFVVSKGGAYFFVPSISALKTKLAV